MNRNCGFAISIYIIVHLVINFSTRNKLLCVHNECEIKKGRCGDASQKKNGYWMPV